MSYSQKEKQVKKQINYAYMMLVFVLLTACAQMGIQPAQSFDQRLGYAYATTTSIRASTAAALDAKTIKASDAQNVLVITDQARAILDQAKAFNIAGDTSTAIGKLTLATGLLTQLQQFLISRGDK